jgi:hypothetical protein
VERIFTNQDFRKEATTTASERMIPLPIHVYNNIFNTIKAGKEVDTDDYHSAPT